LKKDLSYKLLKIHQQIIHNYFQDMSGANYKLFEHTRLKDKPKYIKPHSQKIKGHIWRKIGFIPKDKKKIRDLYEYFDGGSKIGSSYKIFKAHHLSNILIEEKIIWTGDITELTYYIFLFTINNIYPFTKKPHVLTRDHFCDRWGCDLSLGSLRALKSKGIPENEKVEVYKEAVRLILETDKIFEDINNINGQLMRG